MSDHFEGKDPLEHLKDARLKGLAASAEIHGVEISGSLSAACAAAQETAFLILLLQGVALIPVLAGWGLWKVGRSAILGWARLERMHRLIEEERYEIEHHRPQEKEELRALYAAKGFKGKLLDEAVEVLMADDNRLLMVMLQEELGLTIESLEHPLKQAAGAGIGVLIACGLIFAPSPYAPFALIGLAAALAARTSGNRVIPAVIWNCAVATLALIAGKVLHGVALSI